MKICIFTGTRAEYGLLRPLLEAIRLHPHHELQLLVSGTHLSPEFGSTASEIDEQDCIVPVETLLSSDTPAGVAKSFGLGVLGYTDALARIKPDMCILAGDRYEALAFACTAVMLGLPIAHLHGGEISGGSLDEYYRHAITKLSRIHFTSTEAYRLRVIQLGELPEMVHNTGALGLDNIARTRLLERDELENSLGIRLAERNLLITYHPEHALSPRDLSGKLDQLFDALLKMTGTNLIFTRANADANGRQVNAKLEKIAGQFKERAFLFDSLGTQRYLSLLRFIDAVVGNSSSGIIEVPSFGIPTVNVGKRQDGRIKGPSIIDCDESGITDAIAKAYDPAFRSMVRSHSNPYGDGNATKRIMQVLDHLPALPTIKKFHDMEVH